MESASVDSSDESRNWLELPPEVTSMILLKLGAVEILNSAQKVCSSWWKICKDPTMWRTIDMRNLRDLWDMDYDLEKMAQHAVDRSCGQLVDINVEYSGTDDLLKYITDRSSHIRRLRLVSCHSISDDGLSEVVSKLPLLEDLNLSYCSLSKEALEAAGRGCPQLKSFKLNCRGYRRPHIECDEEALAIAENMTELHSSDESRNWLELPPEVTSMILLKLGAVEILNSAQKVCSSWRKICKDPTMWRTIDMRNLGDLGDYDLERMAQHAVDRSCGQLVEINVEDFGTDDLLKYITDRSSHIRRLRLVSCYSISDDGLSEVVSKLPLLEDLDLSYCSVSKEALEAVGRGCPLLKSFKLNQGRRRPHIEFDEEALAIAENMPELHHLQLFGNKLTNDGLQAILDGCLHLESLDLRQCFNVNLAGDLGKRCAEQIKDLRRPYDSTDDYEFDAEIHDDDGSFDEDYPSGFSEIEFLSDDDYYEFSGGSDFSDYGELFGD
ncbi:hypothetical protein L1049_009653 [Liquidambar formosana]|uniref:F-box domain-containing protein n=1 Tax=Liquidambar formosana TaxID=63359 RepID=A0AAP0N8E2_LIQFO